MLHQNWLVRGNIRLLSVHHLPSGPYPAGVAILLAGFSHPMCDADYFMSRLARRLVEQGLYVVQVDPRGHGDSSGELDEVDLDTLRADIEMIVDHYAARFSTENMILIGRGLSATLVAEAGLTGRFLGVAGVAPYRISPRTMTDHLSRLEIRSGDAFEYFPGEDYSSFTDFSPSSLSILAALGSVPYNLHGMRMSRRMLRQLAEYDAAASIHEADTPRALWLLEPFLRCPAFQNRAIARLSEWAVDRCMLS